MPHILSLEAKAVEYRGHSQSAAEQLAESEPHFVDIDPDGEHLWTCADPRSLIGADLAIQTIGAVDAAAIEVMTAMEMHRPYYFESQDIMRAIDDISRLLAKNGPIKTRRTVHSDKQTEGGDEIDPSLLTNKFGCWWLNNMEEGATILHDRRPDIGDALSESGFTLMRTVDDNFTTAMTEARLRLVRQLPKGRQYALHRMGHDNIEGVVLEGDHSEEGAFMNLVPYTTLNTTENHHRHFNDDTWFLRATYERLQTRLLLDSSRMVTMHAFGYLATGIGVTGGTIPPLGIRAQIL